MDICAESKAAHANIPQIQEAYHPPQTAAVSSQGSRSGNERNSTTGPSITTQPVRQEDVPFSGCIGNPPSVLICPPGLEYLTMIDQLLVHREPNLKYTIAGWVSKNKYVITNCREERVYYAAEISHCCGRNCCGVRRAFEMKILDNFGYEVIHINRPLACQHCCCLCCLQRINISAPPGSVVGIIEQQWSPFYPRFVVKDSSGSIVLRIKGPICPSSCCANSNFTIVSADGKTKVGKLYKKHLGCCVQRFTDENVFGVEFPIDLDVRLKATLLGASFLIEMMYFETAGNSRNSPQLPVFAYCSGTCCNILAIN